jgi:hypothetical protein
MSHILPAVDGNAFPWGNSGVITAHIGMKKIEQLRVLMKIKAILQKCNKDDKIVS